MSLGIPSWLWRRRNCPWSYESYTYCQGKLSSKQDVKLSTSSSGASPWKSRRGTWKQGWHLFVKSLADVVQSEKLVLFELQGVTAREMAHYFYDKDVRMDWECMLHWYHFLLFQRDKCAVKPVIISPGKAFILGWS